MNIISNYSKDTQTDNKPPGSYEWWYFDAQSVDGYKIVVIFYEGNPFSRRYIKALANEPQSMPGQYPALSISVYQNENPVFYSFQEVAPDSSEFSAELPFGKIEESHFRGNHHQTRIEYELELNQALANGDSIRASLLFGADIHSLPNFENSKSSGEEADEWNLVLPSCHVSGEIKIAGYDEREIDFSGLGYHDHNTGFEPLKDSFKEWYWGRYHLEDYTFVYYLMNRENRQEYKAWFIGKNGHILICEDIQVSNYGYSFFGLKTARVLKCSANGKDIFLQLDQLLDNGPFYQRFGGRIIVKNKSGTEEAKGISEYIKPERIYSKLFRPLVNMRIAYPGNPHWVQKSQKLYRWTW